MAPVPPILLLCLLVAAAVDGRRHHGVRGLAPLPVSPEDTLPPDQELPDTVNVDYPFPYMKGYPVDSCLTMTGTDSCGKAAADSFCHFQKCQQAVSFVESQGNRGPTWVAGDGMVRESGGGSYDKITCQCSVPESSAPGASDANQIDYNKPEILGHPLDFCMTKERLNCGKPTADAFCESFGNSGSTRFIEDTAPPQNATWFIGDHTLNEAADRHSFQSITCV